MARKKLNSLRCPTCRKLVLRNDPEFPFCSERCRTIDLGKWASGGYVISTPVNDPESGGEAEYLEPPQRRIGGSRNERPGNDVDEDLHGSRKPI
ncbi:MAG TPA: DNA gyrase inhibitor YacG [Clostridia bacterium]|nr:DNA gyrase inhibitor YacG [Clostridia bacterium]